MARRMVPVVLLTLVWVALWRSLSAGFVLTGVALSTAIVAGVNRTTRTPRTPGGTRPAGGATVRLLPAAAYLGRFLVDLVVASAVVAWEVVTPGDGTRPGIVAVPLSTDSDVVITIVANTISLVPGTLTLDARRDPTVLYVHVLHLRDPQDVRDEVHRLERTALRAFGPRPADTGPADTRPAGTDPEEIRP